MQKLCCINIWGAELKSRGIQHLQLASLAFGVALAQEVEQVVYLLKGSWFNPWLPQSAC